MNQIYSPRNRDILARKNVFVGYLPSGFPTKYKFIEISQGLQQLGLDIFELGYPPSNPLADGEVIKSAFKSVDYSITQNMDYWKEIRSKINIPIWIMGYFDDLITSGKYLELCQAGIADAFVIPDMKVEQYKKFQTKIKEYDVDLVYFVRNDCKNLYESIKDGAIIYYQLANGVTGTKEHTVHPKMKKILKSQKSLNSDSPYILGGFGIDSGEKAKSVAKLGFDGAIIGTELLKRLNISEDELFSLIEDVKDKLEEID